MARVQQKPQQQGWEHSVAGAVAGSTTVLLLHPFDVIKTRLQVQDGHQGALLGSYRGALHAIRTIWKQEGWRAFYNGLVPAWLGSGVSWSAYFTAYEAIKAWHMRDLPVGERPPSYVNTMSAAQAGAMVCLLTNPIWLIKTRLQLQNSALVVSSSMPPPGSQPPPGAGGLPITPLSATQPPPAGTGGGPPPPQPGKASLGLPPRAAGQPGTGKPYKGFLDALVRIGKEEGVRGYYKGLAPSLLLTAHGAIQFTVYEELKTLGRRWGSASADVPDRTLSPLETSGAAMLSKLAASVVTYPTQVVRSRIQQRFDLGRTRGYSGVWDVVVKTWAGEGLVGFYKGLGPALVRVLPQSALTLLVYEQVLSALQKASAVVVPRTPLPENTGTRPGT